MEKIAISAEVRQEGGKGPSRQLRMRGLIPAVFYGQGVSPRALAVRPKDLTKALQGQMGRNTVLSLSVDGKEELALVRELQIHPLSRELLHADLYRVETGKPVRVEVPFRTTGKALGVTKGGEMVVAFRKLPVLAPPDKIPAAIEADVTNVDINQVIAVKDLNLPEGVTVAMGPERTIVAMHSEERKKKAMAEEEAAAAAAPAAGAAAPAAGAAAAPAAKADEKKK